MAENNRTDEINLDEIEVEILIIGKNTGPLNQAAAFLIRRGWPTRVHTNLSQAVEDISNNKPDFVLLSVNHPSQSILKFPQAVGAAFNIDCIAFAESGDASAAAKVNGMKCAYKVQGMPSGPNLQRVIRKALAEKLELANGAAAKEESEQKIDDMVDDNGMIISGSGGGKAGKGPVIIQKNERGATADSGVIISQGSKGEGKDSDGQRTKKRLSLKALKKNNPAIQNKTKKVVADTDLVSDDTALASDETQLVSDSDPDILKSLIDAETPEDQGPKQSMILQPTTGTNRHPKNHKRKLKGVLNHEDHSDEDHDENAVEDSEDNVVDINGADGDSGPARAKNKYNRKPAYMPSHSTENDEASGDSADGVALSAVEDDAGSDLNDGGPARAKNKYKQPPLSSSSQQKSSEPHEVLDEEIAEAVASGIKVERIGVFPVQSKTMSGFVIVAVDGIGDASDSFLNTCESEVESQFRRTGVYGELEKGFWLSVPAVDFNNWATEKGLFHFNFQHQGVGVTAAFFPCAKNFVGLKESTRSDMVTVDIADISTEVPVNFKAYIYLEKNKKYFLYLRDGRVLQPKQKAKLMQQGKTPALCVRNKDLQNFKKFQTSNFLFEMIKSLIAA